MITAMIPQGRVCTRPLLRRAHLGLALTLVTCMWLATLAPRQQAAAQQPGPAAIQTITFPQGILAAGAYHTCGLQFYGAVSVANCWGNNDYGQAWDNYTSFTQLAVNHIHSCGLTPTGAVDCWGANSDGQATDQPGPYMQLSAGGYHTCGLTPAGGVECWGRNTNGQSNPMPGPYVQVTAGGYHTCALTPAGAAECWGYNGYGQATGQPGPYTQLSAGSDYTCGLTLSGAADCWGFNYYGQADDQPGPYTQLAAGAGHTCGLTTYQSADCWGSNNYGQATDQPGPYYQITVGYAGHSCGLGPGGIADCWGRNDYGQATDSPGPFAYPPNAPPTAFDDSYVTPEDTALVAPARGVLNNDTDPEGNPLRVVLVSVPSHGALTLNRDGSFSYLPATDYNGADSFTYAADDGRANSNVATVSLTIEPANDPPLAQDDSYTATEDTPLVVPASGVLGNDTDAENDPLTAALVDSPGHGVVTLNPDGSFLYTPTTDYYGVDSFTYQAHDGQADSNVATVTLTIYTQSAPDLGVLVTGVYHNCGLTPDGGADCWGRNDYGQATDQPGPYLQLTAGYYHTCALTPDGAADCWGRNNYGQATDQPGPYLQLTAGGYHTCALTADGVVDCWGQNDYGQAADQPGPYIQLTAGGYHTCALTAAGGADCWGRNDYEQAADQPGPYTQLSADLYHTCGLTLTGAADCWGYNGYGAGNDQPGPYAQVSAGGYHTCGLTPDGLADCWGQNNYGQAADQPGPYTRLAVGGYHSCGLTPAGAADCWGRNDYGQAADQVGPYWSYPNDPPMAHDDNYTTAEDTALVVATPGVLSNDTDSDSPLLMAVLAGAPSHGTLALDPDGSFTYTPTANYHGSDSFTYRASDGQATSMIAIVSLAIDPVNDPPLAQDDAYITQEDTPLSVPAPGVLSNDSDVEGEPLIAMLVGDPGHGVLALSPDGSFNYTPEADYFGPDSFTYRIHDGQVDSNLATVMLTIGPQPIPDLGILAIGAIHACGLTPDGGADCWGNNSYGQADDQAGPFTQLAAGYYHTCGLTPDGAADCWGQNAFGEADDQPGPYIQLVAGVYHTCGLMPDGVADCWGDNNDGQAADQLGPFTQLIGGGWHTCGLTPAGIADCWGRDDNGQAGDQLGPYNQITAGGFHTCGLTLGGAADCWGQNAFGEATDQSGPYTQLDAGYGYTCGLTPDGAADCWGYNNYGQADDQVGPFTQLAAGYYHSCGLTPEGSANCWGDNGWGQADDQPGPYGPYVPNVAPVAVEDAYTTAEDTWLTVMTPGVLGNDTDANSDPLTAALVISPTHGALTLNSDGAFSYLPDGDYNGPDSFTYVANDGQLDSNPAMVMLTIEPVNDLPEAADESYSTVQDTLLTVTAPGVLGNDTDVEGDPLTATRVVSPTHGALTLNPDGSLSYMPEAGYFGPDSFTYVANDGQVDSNLATVMLTIGPQPIPDLGFLVAGGYHNCGLMTPTGAADCWGWDEYGETTDGPGPYIRLAAGNDHTCGLTPTGSADCWGRNDYGQATDQPGPYIQLISGGLHTCGLMPDGAADCWGYNYNGEAEDQPGPFIQLVVGYSHTCGMAPDGSVDCWGWNGFGQADDQLGPYTQISATGYHTCGLMPSGAADCWGYNDSGQATDQPGPYTQLAAGYYHTCGLTPDGVADCWGRNDDGQANDQTGPYAQLTAGVEHTCGLLLDGAADCWGRNVFGEADDQPGPYGPYIPNVAPVAVEDAYATAEDTWLTVTTPGVLGNDTDANNDPLTAALVVSPMHGALTLNADGAFSYLPDGDYNGPDSFTYVANDGQLDSNPAMVMLTIEPVNDPPLAEAEAYESPEGTALTIAAPGVLGNDSDPEGDPLTAVLANGPNHGSLTLNPDGSFTYTPGEGEFDADSFTYRASDGQANSNMVSVNLTIVSAEPTHIYVSSNTGGVANGLSFADEDVLAYDLMTGLWTMLFDGSDVGLTNADVDAFSVQPDGSLLLSLDVPLVVGDLGSVDDSDILRFMPTSLGVTTAGSFELFWDGSAYGLTDDNEDVDALAFAPDGRLLVSTVAKLTVVGLTAQDEDLSALDLSTGLWTLYFDGSDAGLGEWSTEDVYGAAVNELTGDIYLTTLGAFDVPIGVSGDGADVFTCAPDSLGDNTSCAYGLFWDGSAHGFSGEVMDALELGFAKVPIMWASTDTQQVAGGLTFADEDIFAYDSALGLYGMVFDGSDVGLTGDVDALSHLDDGTLLLSLDAEANVPGLGMVDDSDIVRFIPTTLGMATAGSFELYFDGSVYGLTEDGEDVDALAFAPDGRLLVSTLGNLTVAGLTAQDEDLSAVNLSSGVWSLYFDGSDVGLSQTNGEDVNGAWVNADASEVYLTTLGVFDVPGVTGTGSDMLLCVVTSLGNATSCTFSLYWDGSAHGVTSVLDALELIMP